MKPIYFILISILLSSSSFGQKSISSKKQYVIVKSTFDFLKQVDRYKANSFTKFLFAKAGYDVYLDNEEFPEELYYNKCSAMHVDVKDKSNLFYTRNYIELLDCNGKLLYTSKLGKSKYKDYEKAYRESIRNAFSTIENLNLIYSSFSSKKTEKLKTEQQNGQFKEAPKVKDTEIPSSTDTTEVMAKEKNTSNTFLLSATKSETGYYLLNSNNELVFDLLSTSTKDVFIVKNKNGVLTKKVNQWIFEYYEDKLFVKKVLQIKF